VYRTERQQQGTPHWRQKIKEEEDGEEEMMMEEEGEDSQ
jgi:hypothetical protein